MSFDIQKTQCDFLLSNWKVKQNKKLFYQSFLLYKSHSELRWVVFWLKNQILSRLKILFRYRYKVTQFSKTIALIRKYFLTEFSAWKAVIEVTFFVFCSCSKISFSVLYKTIRHDKNYSHLNLKLDSLQ